MMVRTDASQRDHLLRQIGQFIASSLRIGGGYHCVLCKVCNTVDLRCKEAGYALTTSKLFTTPKVLV